MKKTLKKVPAGKKGKGLKNFLNPLEIKWAL